MYITCCPLGLTKKRKGKFWSVLTAAILVLSFILSPSTALASADFLGWPCISGGEYTDRNGILSQISVRYDKSNATLTIESEGAGSLNFWEILPPDDVSFLQQAIIADDNLYYAAFCPAILSGDIKRVRLMNTSDNSESAYHFTVQNGKLVSTKFDFFDELREASYTYGSDGRLTSYHTEAEDMAYDRYFSYEGDRLTANEFSVNRGMAFSAYSSYYQYGSGGIESAERYTRAGAEDPATYGLDGDGRITEIHSRDAVDFYTTYIGYFADGRISSRDSFIDDSEIAGFTFYY